MARYNWEEIKKQYLKETFKSDSKFMKNHNLPNNSHIQQKLKQFKIEKKQLKKEINDFTVDKVVKKQLERVAEAKASDIINKSDRIDNITLKLIDKIEKAIDNIDIGNKTIKEKKSKKENEEYIEHEEVIKQNSLNEISNVINQINTVKSSIVDEFKEEKPIIYIPAKDIPMSFCNLNRWIDNRKYNEIWLEGGRGSAKSSYWSEKIVEMLENNDNYCALLIRKVGNTLKDSVFSQMEWAIDQLEETYPGIKKRWKSTKSPLEMTNVETGQKIYFRGADDPGKIKSIKPPKSKYIALEVYEEFDQMNGMNEVRKIDQSVVRGGDYFLRFRVYNTPKSNRHFVNLEKNIPKEGRLVHKSDYRTVPVEWLGQPFIDDAEYLKSVNEKIYNNEYLGECTGDGGDVFENLDIREITDEEIDNFDYIYMGLDFGWYPDILAWTKMCYQSSKKTLYIFDEFTVNKMSNQDVWNYLVENKGVTSQDLIIADSAEPKSIGDFASYGAFIRGAKKGADSVSYSMKWLSSLAKIVIDPKRCPVSTTEFSTYQYETDKDDNFISSYPDKDNHTIDSVRYAMNPIWKRKGE